MSVINKLRQIKGMNQDQFAEFCGVSRISIARYEAGAEISRANAKKIAAACGVSVDYLLNDDKNNAEILQEAAKRIQEDAPFTVSIKPSDYFLFGLVSDLTPEEQQRVRDFVAGIKSSRKAQPSPDQSAPESDH